MGNTKNRVNKRAFITQVARRASVSYDVASNVYRAAVDEMLDLMSCDKVLSLSGFGSFYPQIHKGHPVQFDKDMKRAVSDYMVLKFSASKTANQQLRKMYDTKNDSKEP